MPYIPRCMRTQHPNNVQVAALPPRVCEAVERLQIDYQPNPDHLLLSREITDAVRQNRLERLAELILQVASLRRFLG